MNGFFLAIQGKENEMALAITDVSGAFSNMLCC